MSAPDLEAQRALLARVRRLDREESVAYAERARALAEMGRLWGPDAGQILELAGTSGIGQDRAAGQLTRAKRLVELFPEALRRLSLGVLRVGTVEILLGVSKNCTDQVQRALDLRLSEQLCDLDAADARRLVAVTIPEIEATLHPRGQRDRHERARAHRGVWVKPVEDGMARIGAEVDQLTAGRMCSPSSPAAS